VKYKLTELTEQTGVVGAWCYTDISSRNNSRLALSWQLEPW